MPVRIRTSVIGGGVIAIFAAAALGGSTEGFVGCENTTVIAAGSPEGEIYTQHGCPDEVIPLDSAEGPTIRHWDKYIVVYNMRESHRAFGSMSVQERRSSISYLVERGKVINGGYVGFGASKLQGQGMASKGAAEDPTRGRLTGITERRAIAPSIGGRQSVGTEVTETLAPGASEGEVLMKHGPPAMIIPLGDRYENPQTGEKGRVNKYLYVYPIRRSASSLAGMSTETRYHNITYIIEGGRVMGGGYVGGGSSKNLFGDASWQVQAVMFLIGLILMATGFWSTSRRAGAVGAVLFSVVTAIGAVHLPALLVLLGPTAIFLWRAALDAPDGE